MSNILLRGRITYPDNIFVLEADKRIWVIKGWVHAWYRL